MLLHLLFSMALQLCFGLVTGLLRWLRYISTFRCIFEICVEHVHVIVSCDCVQGAIVTMTKALAKDLVKKKGVRVNAVAPGGPASCKHRLFAD